MESYIRCSRHTDKHSEVCNYVLPEYARLTLYYSLLNDPNTSSPANVEASNLYKDNRREYTKRVKETVEKSWED